MPEELKSCPCCGEKASERIIDTPFRNGWIGCHKCRLFIEWIKDGRNLAIAAWNRRADGWIPVSEGLPKNEQTVQICATRKLSDGRILKIVGQAMYEDGTVSTDHSAYSWFDGGLEDDDFEYDENGTALVPQGWWEATTYCEQFYAVSDFVTHWQPMPEAPGGE
ncbi:MAG: DUF551 domain-containing protein [Oscillospiraceae bacterium]